MNIIINSTVDQFITGAYVTIGSFYQPFCISPVTNNRALNFLIEPSGFLLHLNSQVEG